VVRVRIPRNGTGIVVDDPVAVVVDIVAKLRLLGTLCDRQVVAISPTILLALGAIAAQSVELRVAISVPLAKGFDVAVLIMVIGVTDLYVPGKTIGIVVIAVVAQGLAIVILAVGVTMSILVGVGRFKHTLSQRVRTAVQRALDAVVAARLGSSRHAAKLVSFLLIRRAQLCSVAEAPVRALHVGDALVIL
jgi:hypothetical protein